MRYEQLDLRAPAGVGRHAPTGALKAGGRRWCRLTEALEMATLEGKLVRNVAKLVKPPEHTPRERDTWTRVEVRKFFAAASPIGCTRRGGCRCMASGVVRSWVCAGRTLAFKEKTLAVSQARLLVEYKVRIEEPKSRNGRRTLPLDDELVDALTELHKRQMADRAAAGPAYRAGLSGLDWYRGG
jgi:integrase